MAALFLITDAIQNAALLLAGCHCAIDRPADYSETWMKNNNASCTFAR